MLTKLQAKNEDKDSFKVVDKTTKRPALAMKKAATKVHLLEIIQRARTDPSSLTQADVMQLQRTIGNQAVYRLLSGSHNTPKHETEKEPVQRKVGEEGKVRFSEGNKTGIPAQLKAGLEALSNIDLSDVQVHHNSNKPKQVGALAYTQGNNIHIAQGQEEHLPHEGWHAVQQKQGRVQPNLQMKTGVAVNDDAELEKEADIMGERAATLQRYGADRQRNESVHGREREIQSGNAIQLKKADDKPGNGEKAEKDSTSDALDILQTVIDVAGFIPVVGDIADALNVIISLIRKKIVEAVISAIAIIPGVGSVIAMPIKTIFKAAGNVGIIKKAISALTRLIGKPGKIISKLSDIEKSALKFIRKIPDTLSTVADNWFAKKVLGNGIIKALKEMKKKVSSAISSFSSKLDEILSSVKDALKKSSGELVEETGNGKHIPNPNGKKGGLAHQGKIQEIKTKYENQGYEVTVEHYVKTPGGKKNARYGDLLVTDPKTGEQFIVQVGKQTKGKNPVSREAAAKADLEKAGYKVEFVPYN